MALIEYDEYKQRLRDLGPELEKLSAALDMDSARAEARKLEDETAQDGFWNDLERSQKVQQRLKQLQNKIARQDKLVTEWQDLTALCEMGQEAEDEELLEELKSGFQTLEEKIEEIRLVNRAKWLLIECLGMTEPEAHRYIEKQSMDQRISKREAAEAVIKTYK